jgi:hypothetical protein
MGDPGSSPVLCLRPSAGSAVADGPHVFDAGEPLDGTGVFARWAWDGDRLIAANDPFGVQPLFYASEGGALRISPSIAALLRSGASPALDDAALAVFVRVGFFVGEDTPFRAIRALPPGAHVEWRAGRLDVRSHPRRLVPSALSRDEAIDAFAVMFTRAVERRLQASAAPIAVPLSGGHDSRHIVLALHALGRRPDRCVTVEPYPPSAGDDVRLARLVADAVGVPHVVVPQRFDRIAAESEKNGLTNFCADEHVQFLPLRDYFAANRCALFDGLAGDVLSQSQRLDPELHRHFEGGRLRAAAETILGDASAIDGALAGLLTPQAFVRFGREQAIARIVEEAGRHAGAPNPIASFFAFTRMRREVALAPCALLDVAAAAWLPFLEADLATLLLSLPFALVADRRLHTDLLARHYPSFAHLPIDAKQPGREDPRRVRRDALGLVRAIAGAPSALVARGAVAARAARALATGRSAQLWFLPKVMHLLDVERASNDAPRRAEAPASAAGL